MASATFAFLLSPANGFVAFQPPMRSALRCRPAPVMASTAEGLEMMVEAAGPSSADDGSAKAAAVPTTTAEVAGADPEAVTLELLEWNRLSAQVASLASTRHGRDLIAEGLPVALSREESEVLHVEMEEVSEGIVCC